MPTVTFFSNYLTSHQQPLCEAFEEFLGANNYHFVAETEYRASVDSSAAGHVENVLTPSYLVESYSSNKNMDFAKKLALESDVAICAGYSTFLEKRMSARKGLTFVYAERLLKRGLWFRYFPPKRLRVKRGFGQYADRDDFYVLCASAFTSYDLSLFGFPDAKCFKWGYFPKVPSLMPKKEPSETLRVLWVGRMIDWKRPDLAVSIAHALKRSSVEFSLTMVGDGPLRGSIEGLVDKCGLHDCVSVVGQLANCKVYEQMREADALLVTSNRKEGWGAVVNEAMGMGCAVICGDAIGAAPYLIRDGENGYVCKDGDVASMASRLETLAINKEQLARLQDAAFQTVSREWNAREAASRFIKLCSGLNLGRGADFSSGPCSPAMCISDEWI